MQPKYKRILLKLSGESLAGDLKHGIDFDLLLKICEPIKKCVDSGVEVGIVVILLVIWISVHQEARRG